MASILHDFSEKSVISKYYSFNTISFFFNFYESLFLKKKTVLKSVFNYYALMFYASYHDARNNN